MQSRIVEIWVGIFFALGFTALFLLALKVSNLSDLYADEGYTVTVKFDNIGGLKIKSPVKISGVRIGRVTHIEYDDTLYKAVLTLKIESRYTKIPTDTSASVYTAGLLGEQYIGLLPGGEHEYLADKGEIFSTQSAIVLEQLIGQLLYKVASGDTDSK